MKLEIGTPVRVYRGEFKGMYGTVDIIYNNMMVIIVKDLKGQFIAISQSELAHVRGPVQYLQEIHSADAYYKYRDEMLGAIVTNAERTTSVRDGWTSGWCEVSSHPYELFFYGIKIGILGGNNG